MNRTLPSHRRTAFALMLVLGLFAIVIGATSIVSLHATQFVRADRHRTIQLELRQMIDSAAAYARRHRETLEATTGTVTLDGRTIAPNRPGATITITPRHSDSDNALFVTLHAEVQLSPGRSRSMSAKMYLPAG